MFITLIQTWKSMEKKKRSCSWWECNSGVLMGMILKSNSCQKLLAAEEIIAIKINRNIIYFSRSIIIAFYHNMTTKIPWRKPIWFLWRPVSLIFKYWCVYCWCKDGCKLNAANIVSCSLKKLAEHNLVMLVLNLQQQYFGSYMS